MSAKNVTITVSGNVVATAGYVKWIQGTNTTYTVAVDTQTDYITVTDSASPTALLATDTLWAAAGDLVYGTGNDTATVLSKGTAGQVLQIGSSAPSWVNNFTTVTFSVSGALAASTVGVFRWYNSSGRTLTFNTVTLAVSTAPLTTPVTCDINVNGTTCFVASSQANRPSIAASANTGSTTTFDSISTITSGQYITVDVDLVGTGTTGSNLTCTIWMTG